MLQGLRLSLGIAVGVCRALFSFYSTSWLTIKPLTQPGETWLHFKQEIVAQKERLFFFWGRGVYSIVNFDEKGYSDTNLFQQQS